MAEVSKEHQIVLDLSKQILAGKRDPIFNGSFGKGFSERYIETQWAASHLRGIRSLLDIGFTFASNEYLGMLLELKDKYGIDLQAADIINPEKVQGRYPKEWLKTLLEVPVTIGDVRTISLPKERFDAVTIISTIEHIGFDEPSRTVENSAFERKLRPEDVSLDRDTDTNKTVLDNIYKTLKKRGKLLLSVPMGKGGAVLLRDSLGLFVAQWEYDEKSWKEVVGHKGFELTEQRFFKLSDAGWTEVASPRDLVSQSSYMKPYAEGCAVCLLVRK